MDHQTPPTPVVSVRKQN